MKGATSTAQPDADRPGASHPCGGPGRRPTVLAVANAEARRHLRHPLFLLACLLSVVLFWQLTHADAPVLHREDVTVAGGVWPIAVASLLIANLATLRARRDGVDDLYGSYAARRATHTEGLLLAAGGPALAAAALVVLEVVWLKVAGGIGWPHPAELAVGPAMVALAATVGVALGRWLPSRLVAPMVITGGAAVLLLATNTGPGAMSGTGRWLLPWVPLPGDATLPELLVRPAAAHLAYLAGVAVGAAAVARLSDRPRRAPAVAAALALVLIGGSGWAQARHPTPEEQARQRALLEQRDEYQVCEVRQDVTYCAYPAYLPWIDRWAAAVAPVVRRLPDAVVDRGLEVRQWPALWHLRPLLPDDLDVGQYPYPFVDVENTFEVFPIPDDGAAHPGAHWGRGPAEGRSQVELAVQVGAWAVGLPTSPLRFRWTEETIAHMTQGHGDDSVQHGIGPESTVIPEPGQIHVEACDASGQARAVVALWAGGQATPAAERALRDAVERRTRDLMRYPEQGASLSPEPPLSEPWGDDPPGEDTVDWGLVEADLAVRLLDRPADDVERLMHEHWRTITDPSTTTEQLAEILDLDPQPRLRELLPDDAFAPTPEEQSREVANPIPGYRPTCP